MKTLQQCEQIVKESKHFLKKVNMVQGYEVISFDYQDGAKYQDFLEYDAFELRGLTFIEGVAFPMLHKFFNLGEKSLTEVDEAKNKTIKSIQIKDDGSLIGFLILPNGNVVAKTKSGFSNPYTDIATEWLDKDDNRVKIKSLYDNGVFPLFECVSFKHKIVLSYDWEGLKLIQARKSDFSYLDVEELETISEENGFIFEKPLEHNLENLLRLKDQEEGIEGFIVRFDDDTFSKVKTSWYFDQHSTGEGLNRVNELLEAYFNGKDVAEEDFEKEFIKDVSSKVFEPFSINSLLELKSFMFRDGDEKDTIIYQQLFKGFLTEYAILNNYDNENTLIRLTIDNSIDDILPELNNSQREFAEKVQSITLNYLEKTIKKMTDILSLKISHKEIQEKHSSFEFRGILLRFNLKEFSEDDLLEGVKKSLLKKTKRVQGARSFINENK